MKIVLQVILAIFMTLYLGGVIGSKQEKERYFFLAAALLMAATIICTIAIL